MYIQYATLRGLKRKSSNFYSGKKLSKIVPGLEKNLNS